MLAYANGAVIEFKSRNGGDWNLSVCAFDWRSNDYRIKPKSKSKFDPRTLQPFDKVLVRDTDNEKWSCNLFSHITNENEFPYMCAWTSYRMAIPYNEDTKHLVGTTNVAPEFYRYWEE